ncbi:hypothetical protein [Rubripirellula reticaptiva]|uniref:PEP-CTERM protein-sorting domain-containing protein n=1 Tax=Rubripirellula reticaptiva TaxID=2528013 RepID=A0A5C6ER07_9BACT|nr:hypothetical protein [Rubripirellula reticaptiva]TWU51368.1 hypothetical protein Poly59_29600 [Rubripirellula reticaptiva]
MNFAVRAIVVVAGLMSLTCMNASAEFIAVSAFNPNNVLLESVAGGNVNPGELKASVASAFANGTGGVIDFELGGALGSVDTPAAIRNIVGTYSLGKELTLSGTYNNDTPANQFANGLVGSNSVPGNVAQALSGSSWLSVLNRAEVALSLSGASNTVNEVISKIGFGIEVKGVSGTELRGFLTTTLSDSTSHTYSFDYVGTDTSTPIAHELFFGFTAPAGLGIAGFSIGFDGGRTGIDNVNRFGAIDDFAFETSIVAVPEVSSLDLVAIAGIGGMARFRRRR